MGTGMPATTTVPVKPASESKINWANAVSLVASVLTLLTGGKFDLTPEMQATILGVISTVTPLVTIILRTYFTKSVVAQAVKS